MDFNVLVMIIIILTVIKNSLSIGNKCNDNSNHDQNTVYMYIAGNNNSDQYQ